MAGVKGDAPSSEAVNDVLSEVDAKCPECYGYDSEHRPLCTVGVLARAVRAQAEEKGSGRGCVECGKTWNTKWDSGFHVSEDGCYGKKVPLVRLLYPLEKS